jgi:rhodanese-related sulfurtransferase
MQIVDVREPAEHATGTLPGAVLAPLGSIQEAAQGWPKDQPLLMVCRSGRRAQKAADELRAMGFECVSVLEGGMEGLKPKEAPRAWALERQVRLVAGSLVFAGSLLGLTLSPWFFGVPLFVGGGLAFAALTDTCAMGMLLMKMPWNRKA